jgi:hypothetical protein
MDHHGFQNAVKVVFMYYAIFWVVVVGVLLMVVGPLASRYERGAGGHGDKHH